MDNKITKKRLNHMFSYEWIVMIALTVAMILIWELCYSIFSVKLTSGQQFRMFYDYGVDGYQGKAFIDLLETEDTFSYEVLGRKYETLLKDSDVLYMRHEMGISDVIFTDVKDISAEGATSPYRRANEIIDDYKMYSFDRLATETEEYLESLKENGEFSDQKIEAGFLARNKKDNRYRSAEQKAQGIKDEKERLNKLSVDLETLKSVIAYDKQNVLDGKESIFYSYTRFEQSYESATDPTEKTYYEQVLKEETSENYGIKLWLLKGGKKNVLTYFDSALEKDVTCKDLVYLVFDMKNKKKDLQFELVSVTATILRQFTNFAG